MVSYLMYVEIIGSGRRDVLLNSGTLLREPLTAAESIDMAVKLKALADPVRLQLFSAIASHTPAARPASATSRSGWEVSAHGEPSLKVLRDAGLLIWASERRGCITQWCPMRWPADRPGATSRRHGWRGAGMTGPHHRAAGRGQAPPNALDGSAGLDRLSR